MFLLMKINLYHYGTTYLMYARERLRREWSTRAQAVPMPGAKLDQVTTSLECRTGYENKERRGNMGMREQDVAAYHRPFGSVVASR